MEKNFVFKNKDTNHTAVFVVCLDLTLEMSSFRMSCCLKGLSHEIDFKNVDENGQILALTRAAAGF
jgi:hypothetical protein